MARPPQAGCCCPQATREQVGFSLWGPSPRHPSLPVPHVRPVLRPVSRVSLPLTGTALPPPGSNNGPSPQPELTLGLRAPPTLLSTSSGGKSAVTHVSSPGTVTRLGSVTHVTTFSHASPGNRGGYNFKVSLSPHSAGLTFHPLQRRLGGAGLTGFLRHAPPPLCAQSSPGQRRSVAASGPQGVGGMAKMEPLYPPKT